MLVVYVGATCGVIWAVRIYLNGIRAAWRHRQEIVAAAKKAPNQITEALVTLFEWALYIGCILGLVYALTSGPRGGDEDAAGDPPFGRP